MPQQDSVSGRNDFLGWIMALEKVKVIGPDEVVDVMKQQLKEQYDMYF